MGELRRKLAAAGRVFWKSDLPLNLVAFVTSRCNLLCRHCFYWQELNQKKNELTLDEYERISASLPSLLSLSLTGGEPYLRKDLGEIAGAFVRNSRVQNIQIPSNGFLPERTVRGAEAVLQRVGMTRVATGVSLDGPEEIHNRIRNHPQSFDRAVESFRGLQALKAKYPNLSVGVAVTVNRANQDSLEDFLDFVEDELVPDAVTITLARGEPLDPELVAVSPDRYRRIADRVVSYRLARLRGARVTDRLLVAKEEGVYRRVEETAREGRRVADCFAGLLSAVISETGEVFPCEVLDRSMGNIRDFGGDFAALWRSQQARSVYDYQQRLRCHCTYECAMSVNVLCERPPLVPLAWRAAKATLTPRKQGNRGRSDPENRLTSSG
ncbi:MAG: hypothetical protein Kow00109_20930 [Acidobacteriota bacterium]